VRVVSKWKVAAYRQQSNKARRGQELAEQSVLAETTGTVARELSVCVHERERER
jgi:hypothetical protein